MKITLTLDDVSEVELSSEQALWGMEIGIIYYCPEHRCYHNTAGTDPASVVETLRMGAAA